MGSSPPPSTYDSHLKVPKKYQILDNLRAVAMGILEIRDKDAYWREKWEHYKDGRKWWKIKPVKDPYPS